MPLFNSGVAGLLLTCYFSLLVSILLSSMPYTGLCHDPNTSGILLVRHAENIHSEDI